MSFQDRLETEYGVSERGAEPDGREAFAAQVESDRRARRVRITEDRFVWHILVGVAVVGVVFALAVWLGQVPLPDWLTR